MFSSSRRFVHKIIINLRAIPGASVYTQRIRRVQSLYQKSTLFLAKFNSSLHPAFDFILFAFGESRKVINSQSLPIEESSGLRQWKGSFR